MDLGQLKTLVDELVEELGTGSSVCCFLWLERDVRDIEPTADPSSALDALMEDDELDELQYKKLVSICANLKQS